MSRFYPGLSPSAVRARAEALERFSAWELAHPRRLSPDAALEGIAALYELLPKVSRARAVDASGVIAMHRALSVLARTDR
jgi:hypothetical protein